MGIEPRVYNPRVVFIPNEQRVQGFNGTAFRTSDGEVYLRDAQTQVIRSLRPKVKGKAARRAEKYARRLTRSAATRHATE